ncbi:transmembrane protein 276 [Discoglossus pictus]
MAPSSTDVSVVLSHLVLFVGCLFSATHTLQVHRGAAAGFLLHGVTSMACFLFPALQEDHDTDLNAGTWVATMIGLPLLAFIFFWLHGDRSTANMMLGSGILLAAASGHMTADNRYMATHLVTAASSLSILIISIFTANWFGIMGGLALSTVGLLSSMKVENLVLLPKVVASNYVLTAALLSCNFALQHSDISYDPTVRN